MGILVQWKKLSPYYGNNIEVLIWTSTTIKRPLTNQMRLIYPINQLDAY
jgi:hypothetical protein